MTIRRSVYLDRLREHPSFTFDETSAVAHRGLWSSYFRNRVGPAFSGRVVLEIGCNNADLLVRTAQKRNDLAFIGLDWKAKAIYDGAQRVVSLALPNIALIRGRAQDIGAIFAEREIDEIWVFHPDPCDKDVELKNRLIAEPFLNDAHHILRDEESLLTLKTDHPGYYQWVLSQFGLPHPPWFSKSPLDGAMLEQRVRRNDLMAEADLPARNILLHQLFDVEINSPDFWNDESAQSQVRDRPFVGLMTNFERRFVSKRLPIYFLQLRRVRDGDSRSHV